MSTDPEVVITRPIAVVFDYLADFSRIGEYTSSFSEMTKTTQGPIGLGTRYHYKMKRGGGVEGDLDVTEFERPRAIGWEGPFAGPLRPRGRYELEEVQGKTRVVGRFRPEFRGVMGLLSPLLMTMVRRQGKGQLDRAKQILEARG
jgi:uncharacterized protein YndB with AHSA1/START domain